MCTDKTFLINIAILHKKRGQFWFHDDFKKMEACGSIRGFVCVFLHMLANFYGDSPDKEYRTEHQKQKFISIWWSKSCFPHVTVLLSNNSHVIRPILEFYAFFVLLLWFGFTLYSQTVALQSTVVVAHAMFFNRNSDTLNTLFWWRKSCNYSSWEGHSLCSLWRIFWA